MKSDYPVLEFKSQEDWRNWLQDNHQSIPGIWLKIYKKGAQKISVTYDEALDDAICFGWIDGQRKKLDIQSFLQKFTPRREKSLWSKKNISHVARLEKEGRMTEAGKFEIQRAKNDGRWEAAYDSQATMIVPEDFVEAVKQNKKTFEFYKKLNRGSLFTICMQLQTAKKPQTREKRFNKLLQMLQNEQKPV